MEQVIMIQMSVDDLQKLIKESVDEALRDAKMPRSHDLPMFLTREETKKLLRISETKMWELMGRSDFPVNRQFGVKIYTDELLDWVEDNMENGEVKGRRKRRSAERSKWRT